MRSFFRDSDSRWREARNRVLNLSDSLAGGKTINECCVRGQSIFEETSFLGGREIVSNNCVQVQEWWIAGERLRQVAWHGVVKNPDSAADHGVMQNAQRLPSKAEPRRP